MRRRATSSARREASRLTGPFSVIRRYFNLDLGDRRLLAEALLLQILVVLGLRIVRFATLRRLLDRIGAARLANHVLSPRRPARIGWAVATSSRRLKPVSSCLTQALTAEAMLRRRGYPAHVTIGVEPPEGAGLKAHAWVESHGSILLGAPPHDRFAPLETFESHAGTCRSCRS